MEGKLEGVGERVLMTMPEEWKDREAAYGECSGVFQRLKEHGRAVPNDRVIPKPRSEDHGPRTTHTHTQAHTHTHPSEPAVPDLPVSTDESKDQEATLEKPQKLFSVSCAYYVRCCSDAQDLHLG